MARTRRLTFLLAAGIATLAAPAFAASLVVPRPPAVLSPDPAPQDRSLPGRANKPTFLASGKGGLFSFHRVDPDFLPQTVDYRGSEAPGTIVIDTSRRFLYLVLDGGKAKRYGVGVGRPGFEWAGTHTITAKAEWPTWTPPEEMRARQPELPASMKGGPDNPLGARALYLGSTLYRIHGTSEPWSIGRAVSSGCIRMRNEDVIDLYGRVGVGTKVVVL